MRLIRLHVENFGVLKQYDLELSRGLNVLHEKNGWGKSTLAVFIKAMFYGLPASTKRSLEENERKKYTPWQGGVFGGSLEFSCEKGDFRIERFFADKESGDQFALYDLSTNKPSDAFSASVGEELFGIDADGFERSTYLSQRMGYGKSDNISIRAKLGDLLEDVNDIGNYDTASETLEKRRRFYQMTGNRGAIAEEQKRIYDLRAELENLSQIEEHADQKKEKIKLCVAEIEAAEQDERELDKKREAFMRARDRAALMEEKGRMFSELSALEARKKKQEEIFCGFIPSEAELNAAKKSLDMIRETTAALNTIPEVFPDAEELQSLRERFSEGIPRGEDIDARLAQCEQLYRLRQMQGRLQEELNVTTEDHGFPSGVPSPEEFQSAFDSLDRANEIRSEIEQSEQRARETQQSRAVTRRSRIMLSGMICGIGAIIAVLALFLESLLQTVLIIGGGVTLLVGVVLLIVFTRTAGDRRAIEDANSSVKERKKAYTQEMVRVEQFLEKCHVKAQGDLSRLLAELSMSAIQARDNVHKSRRLAEQIRDCGKDAEELGARIAFFLSRFGRRVQEADFSRALHALRRDAERYVFLHREDAKRIAQRQKMAELRDEQQADLWPFLKRYDTTNSRNATEIFATVSNGYVTYRALCEELKKKENSLRTFIREKNLDEPIAEESVISAEALAEQEKALQKRLGDLRDLYTRLCMEQERMASELDRIPDLESALKASEERLLTYTANFKTITSAQKMLAEAKEALSTRYLGGMQERFLHYLSELTGEDVPEAVIDSSFDVRARAYGQSRVMESFSRGNQDAIRFCVRLSLTEELSRDSEKPFLLLDDPFVNLDEEHLAAAHRLLESLADEYQIIHMICHEGRR